MSIVKSCESDSKEQDTALLWAAQAGSNSSLGRLLQGYRDYLNLLADDELGPDIRVKASASDLVQDSFLEARRDFGQFTGKSPEANEKRVCCPVVPSSSLHNGRVTCTACRPRPKLKSRRHSLVRGTPFGDTRWQTTTAKRLALESSLRPRGRPKKANK